MPARKKTKPLPAGLAAFDDPVMPPAERREAGRIRRTTSPRSAHAAWEPAADRADPVEVLVESSRTREQTLVPLRWERMAASPFAFLRGSALVMAHDLANSPSSGIEVQLCGDAHLANFGVFASPERRMVFDLNDFDETAPGPFEWDVKRLAASIAVAARENGLDRVGARRAVLECVGSYRDWMERYSAMTHLEVWYAKLDASELIELLGPSRRRATMLQLDRAANKNHLKALSKLTTVIDGRRRIVDDPPIVEHIATEHTQERLISVLSQYRDSLSCDRQTLFDRYRFVDFARKVVGVGSVGTRCWIGLFQGPNGGPLFLQVKEARPAASDVALGRPAAQHEGRRVVDGQRLLQATSDIMLGWATDGHLGIDYYVRQLWDAKGSVDIAGMRPNMFTVYSTFCGWALARGHARSSDSVAISGYIGSSARFAEAIADFAEAYADQTELDHAALVRSLPQLTA
ncbi:MAG: DUF2252 domain-containing protein [Ilumatobacteraceae bacterium]